MNPLILLLIYSAYLIVMSLIALALYGKDKRMAKGGTEVRVKEKTLLGTTAIGGAIGAFIARLLFRHKTNKIYFSLTIYISLLLQLAVLGFMIYRVII